MVKLAVFDWNCTLLDDFKYVNEAANILLYYFGFNHVDFDKHRKRRKNGVGNVLTESGIPKSFLEENIELISNKFADVYEALSGYSDLRDGAKEILYWSSENEYENIIVSNHHRQGILPHIERLEVPIKIDNIYANGAHHNKPPKENIFLRAIEGRDVDLENSIMVGDSLEEIQIGKKYGMNTFWISGGDLNYEAVKDYNPIKISNLTQIKDYVEVKNGKP
mgnify:CR=1 FL=1